MTKNDAYVQIAVPIFKVKKVRKSLQQKLKEEDTILRRVARKSPVKPKVENLQVPKVFKEDQIKHGMSNIIEENLSQKILIPRFSSQQEILPAAFSSDSR